MTVVVTGGSGRLGRSVLERWVADGHRVVNLDRVASEVAGVDEVEIDLTNHDHVMETMQRLSPAVVIHLAAIAVPFSAPEEKILAVNTSMAYSVLTAAADGGATRVLACSSPTVLGYGSPTPWRPRRLPLDEAEPTLPWNAYAASKRIIETLVGMAARRDGGQTRFGAFRPCYVIAPDEWRGAPTQQGHTVTDRLDNPGFAAVSLFNYVDARDVADFTVAWVRRAPEVVNGDVWFVSAADALARRPLSDLIPEFAPHLSDLAVGLHGDASAFSSTKAERELGWMPTRSWRRELLTETTTTAASEGIAR